MFFAAQLYIAVTAITTAAVIWQWFGRENGE